MTRQIAVVLAGFAVLTALPAEARFGKRGRVKQQPPQAQAQPAPSEGYAPRYHARPRWRGVFVPRYEVAYGYGTGYAAAAPVAAAPVAGVAEEDRNQGNKHVWEVVEQWRKAQGGKVAPRQLTAPKITGGLPNPGYVA